MKLSIHTLNTHAWHNEWIYFLLKKSRRKRKRDDEKEDETRGIVRHVGTNNIQIFSLSKSFDQTKRRIRSRFVCQNGMEEHEPAPATVAAAAAAIIEMNSNGESLATSAVQWILPLLNMWTECNYMVLTPHMRLHTHGTYHTTRSVCVCVWFQDPNSLSNNTSQDIERKKHTQKKMIVTKPQRHTTYARLHHIK